MYKSKLLNKLKSNYKRLIIKSKVETYIFYLFMFSNFLFLFKFIGGNAWLTLLYLLLVTIALNYKLNDLLYSFLLVALYSLQFYTPNKYYSVAVFKPFEISPYYQGYLLAYGLNLKNIFLTIAFMLTAREIVVKKYFLQKNPSTFLLVSTISGLIYFFVSLYSSFRYSPYFDLSLVWLVHQTMVFFVAFVIFYIYTNRKSNFYLINTALLSTLFLQSIIGILQFIKQGSIGLPIENAQFTGALNYGASDVVVSLVRDTGTFAHPNQFGLIMTILTVISIPIIAKTKNKFSIFILTSSVVAILLTQSRSAWASLLFVILLTIGFYKRELGNIISMFGSLKANIILTVIILLTSIAVIPRLVKIINVFDPGSSFPVRLEMIKEASVAISMNPWTGYGVGTNEPVIFRLFPDGYIYHFPAPIHNAYFQMLLESGLIGLTTFIFPFVFVVRQIINRYTQLNKYRKHLIKPFLFITLAGTFSFAIYYLFQPHEGFREFYYLGIILGYGMIGSLQTTKQNEDI